MTLALVPLARQSFSGIVNGVYGPIVDGYVYFYESGTTTPKNTYTTAAGNVANANPIRLNARGETPSGVFGSGTYTIKLCDADNAEIWTQDDVEVYALAAAAETFPSWVFDNTTNGLAGTTDGDYFATCTPGSSLVVYKNVSGSAVEIEEYPNQAALDAIPVPATFPVGGIISHGSTQVPDGWLPCDGSAVSRTTYSSLFAAIGVSWGAGDSVTTFNVPDLRGEFLRGLDAGRGVDAGRAFASAQGSANLTHTHNIAIDGGTDDIIVDVYGTDDPGKNGRGFNSGAVTTNVGVLTTSSGGTEARPRNIAVPYIIKAYDAASDSNPPSPIVTESGTARTLQLSDRNCYIRCTSGSATTITVPPESSVAFTTATEVHLFRAGAGTLTVAPGSGVTINAAALSISAQYKAATLKKVGANAWDLIGALA